MQFKAKIKNLALKNHLPAQVVLQNIKLKRLMERKPFSKYNYMDIPNVEMLPI